jgi:hypothetical protein
LFRKQAWFGNCFLLLEVAQGLREIINFTTCQQVTFANPLPKEYKLTPELAKEALGTLVIIIYVYCADILKAKAELLGGPHEILFKRNCEVIIYSWSASNFKSPTCRKTRCPGHQWE